MRSNYPEKKQGEFFLLGNLHDMQVLPEIVAFDAHPTPKNPSGPPQNPPRAAGHVKERSPQCREQK